MPTVIPDDAELQNVEFDMLKDGRMLMRINLSNGDDSGTLNLVMSEKTATTFSASFIKALAIQKSLRQQNG